MSFITKIFSQLGYVSKRPVYIPPQKSEADPWTPLKQEPNLGQLVALLNKEKDTDPFIVRWTATIKNTSSDVYTHWYPIPGWSRPSK